MPPMEPTSQSESREAVPSCRLIFLLESAWYAFGLAVVLALGVVNLFYPFGSDQAALYYGVLELDRGATLYVDYWDNKQPGLFVFYLLAGRLFGFSEFGVHLLELIWMSAFAVVMMATLRPYLQAPWLSALAPAATIGVYYATVGEDELTQLEMLVAFPLYLAAWFALHVVTSRRSGSPPKGTSVLFFLSGFCAAVATLFKLLLAPIPVAFWLVASFYLLRGKKLTILSLVTRLWAPVAAGVSLPLLAVLWWFWQASALHELLWTAFFYPPQAFSTSPDAPVTRLLTSPAFFAKNTTPWLLFVAAAAAIWWRGAHRSQNGPLIVMMFLWLGIAGIMFLVQRFSWWQYHMLLLFAPFGILAVCGLDGIVGYVARLMQRVGPAGSKWLSHPLLAAMVSSAVIAMPPMASLTNPFVTKARPMVTIFRDDRLGLQAYHWGISGIYEHLWKESRFLTWPTARPGPIYVFGNAIAHHFTGRRSPHQTVGSAWEFFLPSQTREILTVLDRTETPYILVGSADSKLFRLRPQIVAFLKEKYRVLKKDDSGIWYERLPEDQNPRDAPTP